MSAVPENLIAEDEKCIRVNDWIKPVAVAHGRRGILGTGPMVRFCRLDLN